MFRTYDDWKLATPPEYEDPLGLDWGDPPEEEEPSPRSLVEIELDDRNDPPILT